MTPTSKGAVQVAPAQSVAKEFTTESGKKVVIYNGLGLNARMANEMVGEKRNLYQHALMSQLVEIDGTKIPMEDYDSVPLKDYHEITLAFAETNF